MGLPGLKNNLCIKSIGRLIYYTKDTFFDGLKWRKVSFVLKKQALNPNRIKGEKFISLKGDWDGS
jgi:hypothetical protein